MNPIEQKIRDVGGTIVPGFLFDAAAELDPETSDKLLDELEKPPHQADLFNPDFDPPPEIVSN